MNLNFNLQEERKSESIETITKYFESLINEVGKASASLTDNGDKKRVNFINEKGETLKDMVVDEVFKSIFDESGEDHQMEENSETTGVIYECSYCSYGNRSKKQLRTHMKLHFERKGYKCLVCQRDFQQLETFQHHCESFHKLKQRERSNHDKSSQSIEQSSNPVFPNKTLPADEFNTTKHKKMDDYGDDDDVDKISRKRQRLVSSLRKQKKSKVFSCSKCEKFFIKKTSLNHHLKLAHSLPRKSQLEIIDESEY